MTAYQDLERLFDRRGLLQEAAAVLHWDRAAMMPKGGAEARAEQLAALKLVARAPLLAARRCSAFVTPAKRVGLPQSPR